MDAYIPQQYPKMLYWSDGSYVVVQDAAEHARYPHWANSPDGPWDRRRKNKAPIDVVENEEAVVEEDPDHDDSADAN